MGALKYKEELKIEIAEAYLSGKGSQREIARQYGVGKKSVERWTEQYKEQGASAFAPRCGNSEYASEFKMRCVEAVLRGEGSVDQVTAKYNISNSSVLQLRTLPRTLSNPHSNGSPHGGIKLQKSCTIPHSRK